MDKDDWALNKELQERLHEVEVNIRWIQRMLQSGHDWQAVICQISQARTMIDQIAVSLVTHHCQKDLNESKDEPALVKSLEDIMAMFDRLARV